MRILMVSHNMSNNALGRAYCLWLVAHELGATAEVVGPAPSGLWPVLASTPFADGCRPIPAGAARDRVVAELVERADILIAVKPLPESFGWATRLSRRYRKPLLLDIDDLDLEVRRARRSWRARVGLVGWHAVQRGTHPLQYRRLRRSIDATARTVSNPVLERVYGGHLIPHVREAIAAGRAHVTEAPMVAFVGSPRPHKGLDLLRRAVGRLADRGYRLVVTGTAPPDAAPWETWVGTVDLAQGLDLVAAADIVALPLLDESWGTAQLPAKLVDAMMAGRAVVASDLEALRWATDGSALLVTAGSGDELHAALERLQDPELRTTLGRDARRIALERFTPHAARDALARAVEEAVSRR